MTAKHKRRKIYFIKYNLVTLYLQDTLCSAAEGERGREREREREGRRKVR